VLTLELAVEVLGDIYTVNEASMHVCIWCAGCGCV